MKEETNIVKNLRRFKEDLKKNIVVEKIIFFGSRASGKPKIDSDINLIVVSKNFEGKAFIVKDIKNLPSFYVFPLIVKAHLVNCLCP